MRYTRKNSRQVSYGEAVGILLLDSPVPFIPGDVANATTYDYPVRFKKVEGFTVERALAKDESVYPALLSAALDLKENGVRAVTGDCGFMALHQKRLKNELDLPVCLSSLFQIPLIRHMLGDGQRIGVITANARSLVPNFLEDIGIEPGEDLVIGGLENSREFRKSVLDECGTLDSKEMEREVIEAARSLVEREKNVRAVLLECSVLPPYGKAVQDAVSLPVFDYVTLIDYMFSAVLKHNFHGFM